MASDLLFISADRLIRWDPLTSYGVPLAENVSQFSVDSSGERIALLRPKQISANGSELFDLDLLYLESKQIVHIQTEVPSIKQISLSPDGAWIAYYPSNSEGGLSVQNIAEPQTNVLLGSCLHQVSTDCLEFAWSPDSRELLWIDSRGIWLADISTQTAKVLNNGLVQINDPEGDSVEVEVGFSDPSWSPTGKFVLLEVHPHDSHVHWNAILDPPTRRVSQVVNSYESPGLNSNLTWLADGKIMTVRSSDPSNDQPAVFRHLQLIPTNSNILLPIQFFQVSSLELYRDVKLDDLVIEAKDRLYIDWLQATTLDHVIFGAKLLEKSDMTIFFDLELSSKKLNPIIETSEDIDQILWAPDGRGFIIVTKQGGVLFTNLDTKIITNIQSQSNELIHSLYWMPSKPRP